MAKRVDTLDVVVFEDTNLGLARLLTALNGSQVYKSDQAYTIEVMDGRGQNGSQPLADRVVFLCIATAQDSLNDVNTPLWQAVRRWDMLSRVQPELILYSWLAPRNHGISDFELVCSNCLKRLPFSLAEILDSIPQAKQETELRAFLHLDAFLGSIRAIAHVISNHQECDVFYPLFLPDLSRLESDRFAEADAYMSRVISMPNADDIKNQLPRWLSTSTRFSPLVDHLSSYLNCVSAAIGSVVDDLGYDRQVGFRQLVNDGLTQQRLRAALQQEWSWSEWLIGRNGLRSEHSTIIRKGFSCLEEDILHFRKLLVSNVNLGIKGGDRIDG